MILRSDPCSGMSRKGTIVVNVKAVGSAVDGIETDLESSRTVDSSVG